MEKRVKRMATSLKTLGVFQVIAGVAASLAMLLFASEEILEVVGEEIMMDGWAIQVAAYIVLASVAATGVVSVFRLRWGWILSFSVAAFALIMALLMGPGTIAITKWSFMGLLVLSIVNWAAAILYYYYDLYT